MKYDNDRNRELEFLDTSKELTTKQILKVLNNIYNYNITNFISAFSIYPEPSTNDKYSNII